MTESVPARHEAPDVAELRRLLSEATPRPWEAEGSQLWGPDGVLVAAVREHSAIVDRPDAHLIAAAANSMESLLDDADALRAELAHMTEARDNARAEVGRLAALVAEVRELHRESRGSLAALYPNPICECGKDYPCPTTRAIGSES